MLGITRLSPGTGYEYLTGQVASGRHDFQPANPGSATAYYADAQARGEAPGWWAGTGARLLGVSGEVTHDQIQRLVAEGCHPVNGAWLGRIWHRYPADTEQRRHAALDKALAKLPADATPEQRQRAWERVMAAPQRRAVSAFDVTVSPVKSVSLLWAFGNDHTRQIVLAAHHAGVRALIAELEEHGAFTRRGANGVRQVDTEGLAVMVFDHRMSRDCDPQLHSHVVVSAKVHSKEPGAPEAWLSLDSRAFYKATTVARIVYERAVEAHLTRHLGVRFAARPGSKIREIAGISADSIRAFSKRRGAIEDEMCDRTTGPDGGHEHVPNRQWRRRAQDATLRTRRPRSGTESTAEAIARWRSEDRAAGLATAEQVRTLMAGAATDPIHGLATRALQLAQRSARSGITENDVRRAAQATIADEQQMQAVVNAAVRMDPALAVQRAVNELARERAVFGLEHLELAIGLVLDVDSSAEPASDRQRLTHLAHEAVRTGLGGLRVVDPPALVTWGLSLRRAGDGQSVYTRHRDLILTTQQVLDAEKKLIGFALTTTASLAPPGTAEHAATRLQLSPEKREALRFLTGNRHSVVALHGPAGSGKTLLQRAVAAVAHDSGIPILGLTVSQNAANVLAEATRSPDGTGDGTGMRCENIAMWLHAQTQPPAGTTAQDWTFGAGQWVIVDEASQASTYDLSRLVELLEPVGGKLVLVGDPHQIGPVGPGGMLTYLNTLDRVHTLTDVHRFTQLWEGPATLRLRAGDVGVLADYDRRARLHGGHRDQLIQRMLTSWVADTLDGQHSLLLVETEADAADLAARAQKLLHAAGRIDHSRTVPLRDGNRCGAGDVIVTRRNDRTNPTGETFVANRDRWRIDTVLDHGDLAVTNTRIHARTVLDRGYAAEHAQLAYAQTVDSAQGQTVDTARALINSDTSHSRLYVMLTRGAHLNEAYVHTPTANGAPDQPAIAVLADILRNAVADRPATAAIQQLWDSTDSLHDWAPIFDDLVAAANAHHYVEVVERVAGPAAAARLAGDPALSRLAASLGTGTAAGYAPGRVLATVAGRRELHTADSVALVLAYRVEQLTTATPSDLARPIAVEPKPYSQQLPTTTNPDHADALRQVAELCDNRIRALAQQAAAAPPPWATALGSPPAQPAQRDQWLRRAVAVAAYRDRYQPAGSDPIGLEPDTKNAVRWMAWQHARIALRTGTLAGQAAEASTRRLRAIISRKQTRELAAPAYVADQLRAAHLRLASARQRVRGLQLAAITAGQTPAGTSSPQPAAPDPLKALHHAANDEQRTVQLVNDLEAQHAAWTRWYTDSFDDRLAGTVAALELNRRNRPGPTTGQPDDQLLDQLHAFESQIHGQPAQARRGTIDPLPNQREDLADYHLVSPYDSTPNDVDGPDL